MLFGENSTFDDDHLRTVKNYINSNSVNPNNNCDISELNNPINRQEIVDAIMHLRRNKAPGIDSIPAEALKNDVCTNILHSLISHCFNHGIVPDKWKQGVINPIEKPNSTQLGEPLTYRGITLLSVPCKVYCDVLNRRLTKWIELNGLLGDEQNGYCARINQTTGEGPHLVSYIAVE